MRDTGHLVAFVLVAVTSSVSMHQWFSRASVVYGSLPLLPASSVLADSSPSKIIPRISRV